MDFRDPKGLKTVGESCTERISALTSRSGVYKMWALKIPSLASVSGFPVAITGPASNDPTRYFVGGTVMQRPGLATVGDSILGAFGGHCDSMNYTGMLVAVSKTTGTVTNVQAMMASPGEQRKSRIF